MATSHDKPSRDIRWRVGARQVHRSRRSFKGSTLSTNEMHPLAPSMPKMVAPPALDAVNSPKTSNQVGSTELVVLQDGDVDPLGVLIPSSSEPSVDSASKGVHLTANDPKRVTKTGATSSWTLKQQWKQHADRLVATYEDQTVQIQANRFEGKDSETAMAFTWNNSDENEMETSVLKKTRARLAQLEHGNDAEMDDFVVEKKDQVMELSPRHYRIKVKAMTTQLLASWDQNHKVEALRVAIKCVKLLADTETAPKLYPCVFLLVSEVLDTFGKLVFDRIHAQASEDETGQPLPEPLGDHFTSADINVQATETCRNWFYKSACIRELLPRIYIEIALLPCYRFLCDNEYPQIVARIFNMIKGIGDPLVALYARLYLSLTSSELLRLDDHLVVVQSSVLDYFYAFQWYHHEKLPHWLQTHGMNERTYLSLHSPAVEWLLKGLARGATLDVFEALVAHHQEYMGNSMVLYHLLDAFPARFYASTPSKMLQLIHTASSSLISKHQLVSLLVNHLSTVSVVANDEPGGKRGFLNTSWTWITSLESDLTAYMKCAAAYMKFLVVHFSHREALILLQDVVRHINAASPQELTAQTYHFVGELIENTVAGAKNQHHASFFVSLIPSPAFLTLLDLLKREASVQVAKNVLCAFVEGSKTESKPLRLAVVGREAAVAHTLLVLACRVHEALDSFSTKATMDEITRAVSAFLTRLGYTTTSTIRAQEDAHDALLMLYTDCRRAFYKLESIQALLSTLVLRQAMELHAHALGRARWRRQVLQSCLAFAQITIPSLSTSWHQLELLISAANIALLTNCIAQMDVLLKTAIQVLSELDSVDVVAHLEHLMAQLLNVLMYAPCLEGKDAFFYVSAVEYAVLERINWPSSEDSKVIRIRVMLFIVQIYALWGQSSLSRRFTGVDSNDLLYGGDQAFILQVQERFSLRMEQIVDWIQELDDDNGVEIELLLDLVNLVAPVLDYSNEAQSQGIVSEYMTAIDRKLHRFKQRKKNAREKWTSWRRYFEQTRDYLATLRMETTMGDKKKKKKTKQTLD